MPCAMHGARWYANICTLPNARWCNLLQHGVHRCVWIGARTAQWPRSPRTHRCGELDSKHIGQPVVLGGWMRTPRKISKQLAFVPLQDNSGVVQLKFGNDVPNASSLLEAICDLPVESVVSIQGTVQSRAQGARNDDMTTGHIEVLVNDWQLLNSADSPLPFYPSQCYSDTPLPKETLRARYRYLDLRREALGDNIRRRSRIAHAARCFLHDADFCEVETPILLRSTPEGAREFLVPTRGAPHTLPTFYALQQSPQQPKQLLMASGVTDRYFQFAKCFRDEDGRKDRQPEFTQIDLEMSFVSGSNQAADTAWRIGGTEVRDVTEGMVRAMWHATDLKHTPLPKDSFPTYSYAEVMQKYGSDKPDLRYGLQIADLCTVVQGDPQFALDLLVCPQYKQDNRELKLSKRQIDQLLLGKDGQPSTIEHFKADRKDSASLASLLTRKSSHLRHVQPDCHDKIDALSSALHSHLQSASIYSGAEVNPALDRCDVFLAKRVRDMNGGSTEMGDLRTRLAAALAQQDSSVINANPQILWVTEFPLFTQADEEKQEAAHGRWTSSHHPFTAPALEDVGRLQEALKMSKPSKQLIASIRGQHYDLVLNGNEIAGGSVRVHDAALQEAIMRKILELSDDETKRFQHLLHALRCGAPPHAGIALGTHHD